MAGGTFNPNVSKIRPGTYINFESVRPPVTPGPRGIALVPLFGHDYGPSEGFVSIPAESPDSMRYALGYKLSDDNPNMLLIREAFKGASEVVAYMPKQGEKATAADGGITATARYGGERGNLLRFSIVANPIGGFDVAVYLNEIEQSLYEGLETIEELIHQDDPWIEFQGEGDLMEAAGVNLGGGTNGETTNADIIKFLDASEAVIWHTMAFPIQADGFEDTETRALIVAAIEKAKTLRDGSGKYRQIVIADYDSGTKGANYPGVINVTNAVAVDGVPLTIAQTTAWVAGQTAGATDIESLTYVEYKGATDVIGTKSDEKAIEAIKNGEFFFIWSEDRRVIVEADINSLVTIEKPYDKSYCKNRVVRVYDTLGDDIKREFPPNKFDNNEVGWTGAESVGIAMLLAKQERGAVKNVDTSADFKVDRTKSVDDEMFLNVGVQAVDSADKLYFTIGTR